MCLQINLIKYTVQLCHKVTSVILLRYLHPKYLGCLSYLQETLIISHYDFALYSEEFSILFEFEFLPRAFLMASSKAKMKWMDRVLFDKIVKRSQHQNCICTVIEWDVARKTISAPLVICYSGNFASFNSHHWRLRIKI